MSSRGELLSFVLINSTPIEVSLRMNDIKLRNTVVAALGVALTVTSFGVIQANSMPGPSKPPAATPKPASKPAGRPAAQSPKPAESPTPGAPSAPGAPAKGNIVDLASSSEQFKTLVTAVKAAGLVEALSSEGPFTLFAPNDKAFAKVPKATLDKLLKPANKEELQKVLKYHVIAGAVKAADVKSGSVDTAAGSPVKIVAAGGNVTVNGAKVIKADNEASNGVVHVIDTVLIPPGLKLK
jgi:uncharacterized surface protein with fasciclin (FAS1) repeats